VQNRVLKTDKEEIEVLSFSGNIVHKTASPGSTRTLPSAKPTAPRTVAIFSMEASGRHSN
jgi:hypothetical protein